MVVLYCHWHSEQKTHGKKMEKIILAFITGLTTGGLSCLAVQGGLLAGSLVNQVETDLAHTKNKRKGTQQHDKAFHLAYPLLIFLLTKLISYTLAGFLLGLVGQMFQLSTFTRAILQIAVGIFMLGNALRILNVHPIFRFFSFEPPAFFRRFVRKSATRQQTSSVLIPAFLGFLTVFMPCGVTQAMMAAAIATADPIQAAVLMAAFTLGTSPVFFAVMYFSFQLGAKLERYFMKFVAIVLLVFALITIDGGITLAGSPLSITRMVNNLTNKNEADTSLSPEFSSVPAGAALDETSEDSAVLENGITITVKNNGYYPNAVHVKAGMPIQLTLVSENVNSCARAFVIPTLRIQKLLDVTGEVVLEIPAQEEGTRIPFSCSMGMYTGSIIVDE